MFDVGEYIFYLVCGVWTLMGELSFTVFGVLITFQHIFVGSSVLLIFSSIFFEILE